MVTHKGKMFVLEEYFDKHIKKNKSSQMDRKRIEVGRGLSAKREEFFNLCTDIKNYFTEEWDRENGKSKDASDRLLMSHKRAIIGYDNEVNLFRSKINDYLKNKNITCWYPSWYDDLVSAIFHECWGFAGIQKWRKMKSQSAKIIGERIYFMENGREVLQEQTISRDRLNQLITALMLKDPHLRIKNGTAEVYTLDGIRIKIYTEINSNSEGIVIEPAIAFRNYVVDTLTFEEQARRKTIPVDSIPLFEAFARIGFNIYALGPVRTGKTTWVMTLQRYEDPSLEGLTVQTDPEVKSSKLNPNAPIIDFVADDERLKKLMKDLLRGDYDYINMLEARDGTAAKISLKATAKGTRRCKGTFHSSDPVDFCYDFAEEIISEYGGDMYTTVIKVAKGVHYLFDFCSLKDKSQKRLKGLYEIRFDRKSFEVTIHQIMKYDFLTDRWTYKFDIGEDKKQIAYEENIDAFNVFTDELRRLAEKYPMLEDNVFIPPYLKLRS